MVRKLVVGALVLCGCDVASVDEKTQLGADPSLQHGFEWLPVASSVTPPSSRRRG